MVHIYPLCSAFFKCMDFHWKISPGSVLCKLNQQHVAPFCYLDSAVSLICICSFKLLTYVMSMSVTTNIFDQYVANLSTALCLFNEQYFRHFPNFLSLALANTQAIQTDSFVLSSCAVKQAEYLCGHKLLSKVSPSPVCHMLPL